nr:MAG TPA: phosphoadenosine-phosphosulfate reductase [Ackermannviridae sp.]
MSETNKKQIHIVSFSGGKDSTAMLLKMIENNMPIDDIIFLDTTVEFPEMYEHITKVEKYIGRTITKLKAEKDFEYMLLHYEKKKGKNKGQKGYSFPDFRNRWCTRYFKKDIIRKYLKSKYKDCEVIEYHGIAIDEPDRLNKNKEKIIRYPLAEWNMTEQDCLNYCYSKGFNWNGLYEKFARLSCWCCPLQRLGGLKIIYSEYPTLWNKLKYWQENTYRKFRNDYTIQELENKFKKDVEREEIK